jgi:hypothetical protein
MKFFGKGSRKFYEQNKIIIDAVIEQGKIVPDRTLSGTEREVHRDAKNKVVSKRYRWNSKRKLDELRRVKSFVVPTVVHEDFCFQPFVEVNFDNFDKLSFHDKVCELLGMTISEWYEKNNLKDEWIENVGIHDNTVKLIDW